MSKRKTTKFINFPIKLIEGFMTDHKACLENIIDYSLYRHTLSYDDKEEFEFLELSDDLEEDKIKLALQFFGLKSNTPMANYKMGKELYHTTDPNYPHSGISITVLMSYLHEEQTEVDKVVLLAYLGLKSILGSKDVIKTNKELLFTRMEGKSNSKENTNPTKIITKYKTRRLFLKVINELELGWGFTYYSYYTRGFYVSTRMDFSSLVNYAEKSRKKNKIEAMKADKKKIRSTIRGKILYK